MIAWWTSLIFIAFGGLMVIVGVGIGGWLMFKGRLNQDSFLTSPKGEVFTIPDEPLQEENKEFLKVFEGAKNEH